MDGRLKLETEKALSSFNIPKIKLLQNAAFSGYLSKHVQDTVQKNKMILQWIQFHKNLQKAT